ncbi:MAG: hypothetical protein GF349_04840 [Candidatus Magasanikbacteria bacterium]|nr:hypothetical protein [Candidatus Magasanikbacteria bacterium]
METNKKQEEVQKVEAPATEKNQMNKKSMLPLFLLGFGLIILIGLGITYYYVNNAVKNLSTNETIVQVADALNIPAATVNDTKISYSEYVNDFRTLKKYYTEIAPSQGYPAEMTDVSDEEISSQVLARLVANELTRQVAEQNGIQLSEEEVNEAKQNILADFENEEAAEKELMDTYGWSLDDYVNKVLKPLLLEQKLQEDLANMAIQDEEGETEEVEEVNASHILFSFENYDSEEAAMEEAQEALSRIQAGEDFAELAAEFGGDATADKGGNLGWFSRGVMVPEFEEAIFALDVGELSDELIKTDFGYHIVKVNDKRTTTKSKDFNFAEFMNDQLREAEIDIKINIENPFADILAE